MERRNAFDNLRGLSNIIDGRVHVATAAPFCVTFVFLFSCCMLSAQPVEDPQTQQIEDMGAAYAAGVCVARDLAQAVESYCRAAESGRPQAQDALKAIDAATARLLNER